MQEVEPMEVFLIGANMNVDLNLVDFLHPCLAAGVFMVLGPWNEEVEAVWPSSLRIDRADHFSECLFAVQRLLVELMTEQEICRTLRLAYVASAK